MVVCCGGGSDQTVEESKVSIVQSFKVNNTWRPEPLVTIRKLVVRDISEVQRYPGLEQLFNDLDTIFHVSFLSNIVIFFPNSISGSKMVCLDRHRLHLVVWYHRNHAASRLPPGN